MSKTTLTLKGRSLSKNASSSSSSSGKKRTLRSSVVVESSAPEVVEATTTTTTTTTLEGTENADDGVLGAAVDPEEEEEKPKTIERTSTRVSSASTTSRENLVLLATAMVAGGIVTYNGGPEESLNKFQEFLSSFFNGLIQNHAAGVGGYIEDVSRHVVCRNRVRALEIFGSAETNRKPDSEEIENVSVEFARVFRCWCVSGCFICGGFRESV